MAGHLNKSRNIISKNDTSSNELLIVELEDRLSLLPQELRSFVLSVLPFHETVKTSVLSKMWRKMWQSLPHLIFDYSQFPDMERKLDHFLQFIHQTLVHHDDSNIKTFAVYLPSEYPTYINSYLVNLAVQHHVEQFSLCGQVDNLQQIADCLFTCSSLTALELVVSQLFLKWPETSTLPNLKKLILGSVIFSEKNVTLDLSSGCPLLESLLIFACNLIMVKVLIISGKRISYLSILHCQGTENCDFNLQTPSLETFFYSGYSARDFNFTTLSSLSFASVMFGLAFPTQRMEDYFRCAIKVSRGLRSAKHLIFNQFFIQLFAKAHNVSRQLTALSFDQCEEMTIYLSPIKEQFQMIFLLLSRCPKLCAVNIVINRSEGWTPDMPNLDLESVKFDGPLIFNKLAFIRVYNCEGSDREFELVSLLSRKAPNLDETHMGYGLRQ